MHSTFEESKSNILFVRGRCTQHLTREYVTRIRRDYTPLAVVSRARKTLRVLSTLKRPPMESTVRCASCTCSPRIVQMLRATRDVTVGPSVTTNMLRQTCYDKLVYGFEFGRVNFVNVNLERFLHQN
jgi:hypothetical protein